MSNVLTQPLPESTLPNQQRLGGVSILVAGAGNLGSPLATLVARTGVGLLRIVDRDIVEEKNLVNQDYRREDISRFKAEALAERLRSQFPGLTVEARPMDLEDLPLGEAAVDVILGALDSRRARQALISEMAWPLGVPVVDGGVGEGLLGRVQVFMPRPGAACLECTWGQDDYRHLAAEYPCVPGGATAAPPTVAPAFVGAAVAAMMTAECVRILSGQAPAESQEIAFDLTYRRFLAARLRRAPTCRFDHEVVSESFPLESEAAEATVSDLVATIERHFGQVPAHLEPRRRLPGKSGFNPWRFLSMDHLRHHTWMPLADLGFAPGDRIRVRAADRSAYVILKN